MGKYSNVKEIHGVVCKLIKCGWTYTKDGKHGKVVPPEGGRFLTIAGSPSDHHSYKNFLNDIKKHPSPNKPILRR